MEEKSKTHTVRVSQAVVDKVTPLIQYPGSFSDALEKALKIKKEKTDVSTRKNSKKNP